MKFITSIAALLIVSVIADAGCGGLFSGRLRGRLFHRRDARQESVYTAPSTPAQPAKPAPSSTPKKVSQADDIPAPQPVQTVMALDCANGQCGVPSRGFRLFRR